MAAGRGVWTEVLSGTAGWEAIVPGRLYGQGASDHMAVILSGQGGALRAGGDQRGNETEHFTDGKKVSGQRMSVEGETDDRIKMRYCMQQMQLAEGKEM